MTEPEILALCTRVLRDLLADDSIELTLATRRPDVDGWDSFAYISFIAIVEAEPKIKFNIADVESFENVGAIVRNATGLTAGR